MSKIKNGRLDQYATELFELQQFGPAGVKWVNIGFTVSEILQSFILLYHLDHLALRGLP